MSPSCGSMYSSPAAPRAPTAPAFCWHHRDLPHRRRARASLPLLGLRAPRHSPRRVRAPARGNDSRCIQENLQLTRRRGQRITRGCDLHPAVADRSPLKCGRAPSPPATLGPECVRRLRHKHPVVLRIQKKESRFDDWSLVLFERALLAEGGQLDDPAMFVRRINELMLS